MKTGLYKYFAAAQTALMDDLTKKKQLDDDVRNRLHAALKEYKEGFVAEKVGSSNGVKAASSC